MLKRLPPEQLSQLAKDIMGGQVFIADQLPEHSVHLLPNIFVSLGLGGLSSLSEEDREDIGFIYEYLNQAGPLGINGYPMFFSCKLLGKEDTKVLYEKLRQVAVALEAI